MGNRPNDVHLHDLGFYTSPNQFGHVTAAQIPMLDHYPERAMVLPGISVLSNRASIQDILSAHHDLRELGIGAKEVFIVPETKLAHGLCNSPENLERVKRHMDETGGMIRLFHPTKGILKHLKRAGFRRGEHVMVPPLMLVQFLNDKLELRRIGEGLIPRINWYGEHILVPTDKGFASRVIWRYDARRVAFWPWLRFPYYRTCKGEDASRQCIRSMLRKFECVFIKEPALGGGAGMLRITRETPVERIDRFLHAYATGECTLIVDEGIEGVDISVQWFIHPDGRVEKRFITRQYIVGNSLHVGNGIAPALCPHHALPENWSEEEKVSTCMHAWENTEPIVQWACEHGYVGPIGFDLRATRRYGITYILECNGRFTAAGYPASVQEQLGNNVAVGMRNCKVDVDGGYNGAKRALGDLMLTSREGSGIIIATPGSLSLPLEERKTFLIAVGKDLVEVEALFDESVRRLSLQR